MVPSVCVVLFSIAVGQVWSIPNWLRDSHNSQPWVDIPWRYTRDVVMMMDIQRVDAYKRNMEFTWVQRRRCKPRDATLVAPEVCPPEKIYRWYTVKKARTKRTEPLVLELDAKCSEIDRLISKIKKLKDCNDNFFKGKVKAVMTVAFTTRLPEPVVIVRDMPKTFEDMPEMMRLLFVLGVTIPMSCFLIFTCSLLKKLGVWKQKPFEVGPNEA